MLEQLINLVKEHAGNDIVNNNDVPNEHNDAVIETTAGGIMDHLTSLAGSGGLDSIKSMFSVDQPASATEVSGMSSGIAQTISSKFGIDASKAEGIVKNLIPTVMNNLSKKTNDPNDNSFSMEGILGALTGGSGGLSGVMDGLKKMF